MGGLVFAYGEHLHHVEDEADEAKAEAEVFYEDGGGDDGQVVGHGGGEEVERQIREVHAQN